MGWNKTASLQKLQTIRLRSWLPQATHQCPEFWTGTAGLTQWGGHFSCSWGLHSSFDCWAINKDSEHWQSNSWIRPLSFSVVLSVPGSVMSSLKLSLKVERWWMARSRAWATVGCAKRACKPCTAEALDLWWASQTPVHHSEHSRAWTPLSSSKGGALGRCVLAEFNRPFWCVPGRTN